MADFADLGYRTDSFRDFVAQVDRDGTLIARGDTGHVFAVPGRPDLVIRLCAPADQNLLYAAWAMTPAADSCRPFVPVFHDMMVDCDTQAVFRSAVLMERLWPRDDEGWRTDCDRIVDCYLNRRRQPPRRLGAMTAGILGVADACTGLIDGGRPCPPDINPDNIMVRSDDQPVFADPMPLFCTPADIVQAAAILEALGDPLPAFPASVARTRAAWADWVHGLDRQAQEPRPA